MLLIIGALESYNFAKKCFPFLFIIGIILYAPGPGLLVVQNAFDESNFIPIVIDYLLNELPN